MVYAHTRKDFKHFEKKPSPPYNKPIPVLQFNPEEHSNTYAYIEQMRNVRDWHQNAIDNTNPKDPIFASSLPRHKQIRDDIDKSLNGLRHGD